MKKKLARAALIALLCLLALGAGGFAFIYFAFDAHEWQKIDLQKLVDLQQTSRVYDGNGALVQALSSSENRTVVPIERIPRYVQDAFIAAEDLRFYEHSGFDIVRMVGALINDIKSRSLREGASTITQQLVKLTHLTSEKTFARKFEEIYLAWQLEQDFSKDEILEMYLNYIYFGNGAYGIQAAAQTYFGVDVEDLSLVQAAGLAATIKAPSAYAPHLEPENNRDRRNYILRTMAENGFITQEEASLAQQTSLWVLRREEEPTAYGWFVDEALRQTEDLLNISADALLGGGYHIYTTLQPELQQIADALYADAQYFPPDAQDGTPIQSAMSVVDARTGAIVAMIGGREYSVRRGLNRAVQMRRQPGSVLKPLSVYGPALELGYTTASVLLDEQGNFGGYTPQNAGGKYYGRVSMRTALRRSLNVPAVRLLQEIGLPAAAEYLARFGIETSDADLNLSLALGSMSRGVTPTQLAAAYAAYAAGGVYRAPYVVERIEDSMGNVLYAHADAPVQVVSAQNAYLMTSMLQTVTTSGTGSKLGALGIPVAGKTGTVSMAGGNRDIWMAAYTPQYAVVTWMGFDQTDSAHKIANGTTGGANTAALAAAFFREALAGVESPEFPVPDGLIWLTLDERAMQLTGQAMLASDTTPARYRYGEVFLQHNRPYDVSTVWNPPLAPMNFYIDHASSGKPLLHFTSAQYARYRIVREAAGGETLQLTEMVLDAGQEAVYEDADAQVGVTYTYRVIPIHEELLQEGVWLEGQSAAQVAQARWTYDTLLGGLVDWLAPAQEPTPSPTERTSLFW